MDSNKVEMIVVTIFQIPSFCCAMIIFFKFLEKTSPLRRLQNQLLMYLLIFATCTIIIELPNTQKFLWTGSVTIQRYWFCYFWNILFSAMATLNRALTAFMSIERHFLVFHPHIYRTSRSRFLFHYSPLICIIVIIIIYISVTHISVTCPNHPFNYSMFLCGYTCASIVENFGTTYVWLYVFLPTMVTTIACLLLPIRFIIQKRHFQRIQWYRARKMIIQTSFIASIYTICWLPNVIILQLLINKHISTISPVINLFLTFTPYVTSLLTPFIVLHTASGWIRPAIIQRIKCRLFPPRQGVIQPITNLVVNQANH
ncbi:unnamed protein product [Rotaria sordida]|uniref:G-protein coupled receptors family 1 profile domain-containing protein n=1 Tax=Rotaria sordida TaxID=392033 RepID=A0A814HZC0_9BILA|nr:unnamed protein product [Rotaria sordida]CAF1018202.1 unnamed protein product [Rotaria sordida]